MENYRNHHQYLILGAGPAGLQLAYYLKKSGRDYLVLERNEGPGSFFGTYPRHRQLISINKVYSGYDDPEIKMRWDWNSLITDEGEGLLFADYTKDYFPEASVLPQYLADFAKQFDLNVRYQTAITRIAKDKAFHLEDDRGNTFSCDYLIVATGLFRPYLPGIPGIELCESYTDISTDPQQFINQRVLIIGKGNSALETADNLVGTAALIHALSPSSVRLAWQTHYVGDLRAVNNNLLDTYQLKSQNALLDASIKGIRKDGDRFVVSVAYTNADEEQDLTYDRVILCTGWRFDDTIFHESCRPLPSKCGKFPAQTSAWESVNVENLYFGGTLMQIRGYRKNQSGFIHGFRYNMRTLSHILNCENHETPWPARVIAATAEALTEAILARLNRTAGLWQQFNTLGDLIVISEMGAQFYEELPLDYIQDSTFGQNAEYFTINLEFGDCHPNPFSIRRHPSPDQAERSSFLHPIIRHFKGGEASSKIHLLENLFGEWKDEYEHVQPLKTFLCNALERVSKPVGGA